MLGVDPDTLRRWADNGKVAVFTTPGRHRRFLKVSIDAMLPRSPSSSSKRPSLSAIGEPPDRIAAEFRKRVRTELSDQDWRARFDEGSLRWFRERGMRMSDLLIGSLDTASRAGRDRLLTEAEVLGREYGVEAKRTGLSLGETTQAFLFFRARFMAEIAQVARRRGLETTQAASLFTDADRALDRVILALVTGHQA
jgi:hypothetical protein